MVKKLNTVISVWSGHVILYRWTSLLIMRPPLWAVYPSNAEGCACVKMNLNRQEEKSNMFQIILTNWILLNTVRQSTASRLDTLRAVKHIIYLLDTCMQSYLWSSILFVIMKCITICAIKQPDSLRSNFSQSPRWHPCRCVPNPPGLHSHWIFCMFSASDSSYWPPFALEKIRLNANNEQI